MEYPWVLTKLQYFNIIGNHERTLELRPLFPPVSFIQIDSLMNMEINGKLSTTTDTVLPEVVNS